MSRMFPWETCPTLLIGYLFLNILDLAMATVPAVPSTCGHEFFLPPVQNLYSTSLLGWVEVVGCRDVTLPPLTMDLTLSTTTDDVVHKMTLHTNQTANIDVAPLIRKNASIGKYGLRLSASEKASAYARLSGGRGDVITLLPLDALGTYYLVPDLRTSDFEEQRVVFFSIYSMTNVTLRARSYTGLDNPWSAGEGRFGGGGGGDGGRVNVSQGEKLDTSTQKPSVTSSSVKSGSSLPMSSKIWTSLLSSTTTIKATPAYSHTSESSNNNDNNYKNSSTSRSSSNSSVGGGASSTATLTGTAATAAATEPSWTDVAGSWWSNPNVTTRVSFLTEPFQSRQLLQESTSCMLVTSTRPVGLLILVTLASFFPPLSGSAPEVSSASWEELVTRSGCPGCSGGGAIAEGVSAGAVGSVDSDEEESVSGEMLPPLGTLGKHFYLPTVHGVWTNSLKLLVSGITDATLEVHWHAANTSSSAMTYLVRSPQTVILERPVDVNAAYGDVSVLSTSPVLVYVVLELCADSAAASPQQQRWVEEAASYRGRQCYVNALVLPPVEQYFRCSWDLSMASCGKACPSFWTSDACASLLEKNLSTSSFSSLASFLSSSASGNLSSAASSAGNSGSSVSSAGVGNATVLSPAYERTGHSMARWQVAHHLPVMLQGAQLYNLSESCLTTTSSGGYLSWRLNQTSLTYLPAGSRLAPLYGACVAFASPTSPGDGADNDCDGQVDEEAADGRDDDLDGLVDEDLGLKACGSVDTVYRSARSGSLQSSAKAGSSSSGGDGPWYEDGDGEESDMPMVAVIISLCVALLAVVGVIGFFLLMELLSRRRQIRNTKIRPFVS